MIILLFLLISAGFIMEVFNFKGQKYQQFSFIFLLILLVVLEGSKWESGIDFANCYHHFIHILLPQYKSNYEVLYDALVFLFASLKLSYSAFLFIYFTGVYVLYYFAINKLTENRITALLFIFVISIGLMGSNRQVMALALGFFGAAFGLPSRKWLFVAFVCCSTLIHQSAFFLLPLVFMEKAWKIRIWIVLMFFALLLQITGWAGKIFNYLVFSFGPEISIYRAKIYTQMIPLKFNIVGFVLGICRRLLPIILMFLFQNSLNNKKHYYLVLNILCLSLFLYILMYHDLEYIISRIGVYFLIFEAILYSWLVADIRKSKYKWMFVGIYVMFCGFLLWKNTSQFPELFFPFKTIFGTF